VVTTPLFAGGFSLAVVVGIVFEIQNWAGLMQAITSNWHGIVGFASSPFFGWFALLVAVTAMLLGIRQASKTIAAQATADRQHRTGTIDEVRALIDRETGLLNLLAMREISRRELAQVEAQVQYNDQQLRSLEQSIRSFNMDSEQPIEETRFTTIATGVENQIQAINELALRSGIEGSRLRFNPPPLITGRNEQLREINARPSSNQQWIIYVKEAINQLVAEHAPYQSRTTSLRNEMERLEALAKAELDAAVARRAADGNWPR
jgi:prefoldin subunit 5